MKKRLIWNFEIDTDNQLDWDSLREEKEDIRWEKRYFFDDSTIINLSGLSEQFLNLSQATIEYKEDHYLLIPQKQLNIKYRDNELLYKPRLKTHSEIEGYGKKINLNTWAADSILPGEEQVTAKELINCIEEQSHKVTVIKEAIIYKLPTKPKIKLEFARIIIENNAYLSVCVESRSHALVKKISKHLMGECVSCDYVSFLNKILKL